MPNWLRYGFLAALTLAGVSIFGLAATASDSRHFERWYPALVIVNRVIVVLLFAIVIAMAARLWQRFRSHEYGAHMTTRLALLMMLLAFVPCFTIYLVSNAFISRSIDSWFDVRVEKALDSGVTITRGILTQQQQQTELAAKHMAEMLSNTPASLLMSDLMQLLEGHPNMEALIFLGNGTAVAAAGSKINVMLPDLPTPMQLQTVRTAGIYSVIDGEADESTDPVLGTHNLSIRVIVPIPSIASHIERLNDDSKLSDIALLPSSGQQQLYLQVVQPVSNETTQNAAELLAGYRDYQTLMLSRASLQTIYTNTLFLVLLLSAFGAIAAALAFARKTVEPVMQLEQGTRRVADGNFQPIREFTGNGEINVLTQSFNTMIREVAESRRGIEEQRRKAEQAQAYLERILGSISSGVLVLNRRFQTISANASARTILGDRLCRPASALDKELPDLVQRLQSVQLSLDLGAENIAGLEYSLKRSDREIPLFIKASSMPLSEGEAAIVLVFDDVTDLMEAQRATAWGEVARRLAHEIKNPLTPIRLTAERLELRLESKLQSSEDRAMLKRCIETITTQVDALKQMVNDFREYAKLPAAKLAALNLNEFIKTTAALYDEAGTPLTLQLSPDLPLIEADPAQLRQVLHNLISNSIDAAEGDRPEITVQTDKVAGAAGSSAVRLRISDNGAGFSEDILSRAFEPYITTKPTGTGLGLPMVKKILDEHQAAIHLSNRTDPTGFLILGAQVDILFKHLAPGASAAPAAHTTS